MKRKVLFLLAIIAAVSLSACADKSAFPVDSTGVEVVTSTVSTEESRHTEDASDSTEHQTSSSEQVKEPSETESIVSKPTDSSETEISKCEFEGISTQSATESPIQAASSVSETQEPSQAKAETTVNSPTESVSEALATPNATAADTAAVSAKVLDYLNQYRAEQGTGAATELPGLAEYARYRSRQLVSNFAHDTDDERAAATALQYGKLIDPSLYEMEGDPYYTACAREAIAKAGYVGCVDSVAEKLAQLVRNSSGHWAYVGSGQYSYIAVGVTYESGMWYCDIAMAMENYG